MDLIVRNIGSLEDYQLLMALAKRLGAKPVVVQGEVLEDMLLCRAIKEAEPGQYVSKEQVMQAISKIK